MGERANAGRWLAAGVVAVAAVAAIVGVRALDSDDEDVDRSRVLLEPVGARVPDAFGPDLDVDAPGRAIAIALSGRPSLGRASASALSGSQASGDVPGLFGGSRDASVCRVEDLVAFLTDAANAEKAQAWADAVGIDVEDIAEYVEGLTAARLRWDTRVTNHGFADGVARPVQSILQAGTAVLVDAAGVPRVKCSCGNPLLAPAAPPTGGADAAFDLDALAVNPGDAWPGFDPALVVTIEPAGEQRELVLVDLESGELFARPNGSNGDADRDVQDLEEKCEGLEDSPSCPDTDDAGEDESPDVEVFCTDIRGVFSQLGGMTALWDEGVPLEFVQLRQVENVDVRRGELLDRSLEAPPEEIARDIDIVVGWVRAVVAGTETVFPVAVDEALDRIDGFEHERCE